MRLDIIFAAPHPDDLEIGSGGTIAKLVRQGYKVGMVHLTDGEPTPRRPPGGPTPRATVVRKYKANILVGMAGRTPAASPDHYQAQLLTEAARFYAQFTKWDD